MYSFKDRIQDLSFILFSVCTASNLGNVHSSGVYDKELTFYPEKEAFRKHCLKRRKCCLPAIPPFPTMFLLYLEGNLFGSPIIVVCKCFHFGPIQNFVA